MTIPPIEYLTAANARRLRDPRVMGLDAFIHPYTDDAGAASVAQALARLPEHWKATPVCVAFSRLFAVDQTSIVERGDVVEGRRVEARRDPAEVTGIEVLLSCGGARWWTYISRGEIDEFGETGALRRRIVECDDHDFPRDPRTWRHTPPDAVGLWRYECGSYKIDGSPRTATYRHRETGHRVTVSSDIGADFTADVMDALRCDGVELAAPTTHGPELDPAHLRIYRSDPGIEGAPYVRVDAPVWRLSGERVDATPPTARIDPATREANITVNMSGGLRGSAAVIAKRLREIMDRQPASARPHARTRGDSKMHGMLVDDMLTMLDQRERGPGIVHVRGIEPRPVATVGYDDPTGDDIAADWRRP